VIFPAAANLARLSESFERATEPLRRLAAENAATFAAFERAIRQSPREKARAAREALRAMLALTVPRFAAYLAAPIPRADSPRPEVSPPPRELALCLVRGAHAPPPSRELTSARISVLTM